MKYALHRIRQFLREQSGVNLGLDKDYLIESRLHSTLKHHKLADFDALARELADEPGGKLASAVITALTTHETSWFRDQRPFDRLRSEVLPRLREGEARQLSVWSAACSSGQEIYSIAMLLREEGFIEPAWQISLLASDICESALARAQRGIYSPFEVARGLPDHYLARYFLKNDEHWEITPLLRERISFALINLIRLPAQLVPFDIIFCRNVLIYFDTATQGAVLQGLHDRLRPGGVLFLGAAESPLGLCEGLQPSAGTSGLYYRV